MVLRNIILGDHMSYFPGTYILKGQGSTATMTHLIDDLMTPRLMGFRQIHIADEQCELRTNLTTWYTTFGNWNGGDPQIIIRKNGKMVTPATFDYVNGEFTFASNDIGADSSPRDVIVASYSFDYFPTYVR